MVLSNVRKIILLIILDDEIFDPFNRHDDGPRDEEILEKRREIADKSLISAVKIVLELRRA